ncbi:MAG: hypothetical protein LBK61_11930 [Spirochaetaceae bacterium]|nr:hypothetical protein [Spirochaetaceae bacterium]
MNNREPLFWSQLERARFMRVLNEARVRYTFELRGLSFNGPAVSFYIKPADGLMHAAGDYAVAEADVRGVLQCDESSRRAPLGRPVLVEDTGRGEPPEEEIAAGEAVCGDCAGNAVVVEAGEQIPKARFERGPPDGDSHREGKTA